MNTHTPRNWCLAALAGAAVLSLTACAHAQEQGRVLSSTPVLQSVAEAAWRATGVPAHLLPHLRATRGCIINIASGAALRAQAGCAGYSASKGALADLPEGQLPGTQVQRQGLHALRAQCRAGAHDGAFCAQVAQADLRRFLSGQAGPNEYQTLADLPPLFTEVAQAWEAATEPARARGIRVVNLRFGMILARQGGALAQMLPLFQFGLGGRIGCESGEHLKLGTKASHFASAWMSSRQRGAPAQAFLGAWPLWCSTRSRPTT